MKGLGYEMRNPLFKKRTIIFEGRIINNFRYGVENVSFFSWIRNDAIHVGLFIGFTGTLPLVRDKFYTFQAPLALVSLFGTI